MSAYKHGDSQMPNVHFLNNTSDVVAELKTVS